MRVLGLDPGFASFGYAGLELIVNPVTTQEVVLWPMLGVLRSASLREVFSAADDDSRRTRQLWRELSRLVTSFRPDVVAVEAIAFPRGRTQLSVLTKQGRARALVDVAVEELGATLVELQPQRVRKLLGLTEKGKDATRAALEERWPALASRWGPLTLQEHTGDAAAVATAALILEGRLPPREALTKESP